MKPAFVADLKADTSVTSFFMVCEKELRTTREGKAYLRLGLGDRSGTVEARLWDNVESLSGLFAQDDIVKVHARVESFRNKLQLSVDKVRRAEPGEVDLADYFPHTAEDVEDLYRRLLAHVATVSNPWLNRLLRAILEDPLLVPRLKRAPAAKVMHHAYLGGLLEHVVSLCDLSSLVAGHYKEIDLDLLLTVALLHDIGKLEELTYARAIGYSTEGQLLGHIVMAIEQVGRAMDAIEGFPPELKTLVKHLLISHHGQYEFGSPKLPMIREALVFSFLDDLDSKMGAVRAALALDSGDELWSVYVQALSRRFLRTGAFRQEGKDATAPDAPQQFSLSATAGARDAGAGDDEES
jgi:3'-5' exoribonuclease